MATSLKPIYVSPPTWRSLGNEYRIYEDRVELECRFLFTTFVVPLEEIKDLSLFSPPVLRTTLWALKIDCADMYQHLGIERVNGFMKNIRFTPEDPQAFMTAVQELKAQCH